MQSGQHNTSRRLGERINDVSFWRNELISELERLLQEIERLQDCCSILNKAIKDIESPLHIAEECLYYREARKGMTNYYIYNNNHQIVLSKLVMILLIIITISIWYSNIVLFYYTDTERVHDESEKCLFKEIEILNQNRKKLETCLDKCKNQVILN